MQWKWDAVKEGAVGKLLVAAVLQLSINSPLHLSVFNYLENNLHSIYSSFEAMSKGP